jgi:hypothetical protein
LHALDHRQQRGDELDLIVIDPLPTWVWYQDMADFASGLTNERAGQRLDRAIQGKGAFLSGHPDPARP